MPWFFSRSRFAAMEERLEKVERDLRATVLEAEDLYEKARKALGRAVKRGSLGDNAAEGEGSPQTPEAALPAQFAHLDPVSRRIIAQRRSRFHVVGGGR